MNEHTDSRQGRFGRALERLLIAFVCLEPRLTAAYEISLAEAAGLERDRGQRPAAEDGDSIPNRRHAPAAAPA